MKFSHALVLSMDRIAKVLAKLSLKERAKVQDILNRLAGNNTADIDIKKLKGRGDLFRARKGSVRIIYRLENGKTFLLAIERRTDTTYKF